MAFLPGARNASASGGIKRLFMMASKRPGWSGRCRALLLGLAILGHYSCIHRGRAAIAAYTDQNRLFVRGDCPQSSDTCEPFRPIAANEYASEQYDHYRESGFVTLNSSMRLRVVAPLMRQGSTGSPVAAVPAESTFKDNGTAGSSIDVKSTDGLMGYQTSIYTLVPGPAGTLSLELADTTVKAAEPASGEPVAPDLLAGLPKHAWFRLYFQLRHSMKDHTTVLLMAKTQGLLNEASGEFEENPDAFCAAPQKKAQCFAFPKYTAATAEVKLHVRKKTVFVPISSTLRDALHAYGDVDAQAVAPHLAIHRLWNSSLVPVRFDRKTTAILSLPVVAGDRITW